MGFFSGLKKVGSKKIPRHCVSRNDGEGVGVFSGLEYFMVFSSGYRVPLDW